MTECNCVSEGTDRDENCGSSTEDPDGHRWLCTKPEGHIGPHSACNLVKHPAWTWEGSDD